MFGLPISSSYHNAQGRVSLSCQTTIPKPVCFFLSSQASCLRTVDRKDLVQTLSPCVDDAQNLGKIVHDYVGKPFVSTWQVGGDYELKIALPLESDG